MRSESTSGMRRIAETLVIRLMHGYYFLARGMTLGVRAACFDEEGRIFLVRHTYVQGWHMPGGGVERGETALEALKKELREEGNLEMSEPAKLMHVYFNTRATKRDHVLFYRVSVRQTQRRQPDHEIAESGFFSLNALPEGVTPATHRRIAELSGGLTPADYW